MMQNMAMQAQYEPPGVNGIDFFNRINLSNHIQQLQRANLRLTQALSLEVEMKEELLSQNKQLTMENMELGEANKALEVENELRMEEIEELKQKNKKLLK